MSESKAESVSEREHSTRDECDENEEKQINEKERERLQRRAQQRAPKKRENKYRGALTTTMTTAGWQSPGEVRREEKYT